MDFLLSNPRIFRFLIVGAVLLTPGCQIDPPSEIPQRGLTLWLKADVGLTVIGTSVSQWADQSGNGNDAVQSDAENRPMFIPDGLSGKPVLRFNGVNDRLGFIGKSVMSSISMFIVFRMDSALSSANVYDVPIMFGNRHSEGHIYGMGTLTRFMSIQPDTVNFFVGPSHSVRAVASNVVAYGKWNNLSVVSDRTVWNTTVHVGGLKAPIITVGANIFLAVPLGNSDGTGMGGVGSPRKVEGSTDIPADVIDSACEIAEVIVYDRPLTDSLRNTVEHYLAAKYNLPPMSSQERSYERQ
jgi:hypothetical protein